MNRPNADDTSCIAKISQPSNRRDQDPTGSHYTHGRGTAIHPLTLRILGRFRLSYRPDANRGEREITGKIGPRLRELLTFIALHREGVRRNEVIEALWPDANPHRHTHALNAALGRLRRALGESTQAVAKELILSSDQRFRLNPAITTVDVWQFHGTSDEALTTPELTSRIDAYRRMISLYSGPLAEGLDKAWIVAPRRSLHRMATGAVRTLARLLADIDPQQSLNLLDSARDWDPYNEEIYQDIMRLLAKIGQHGGINRTLQLLTIRLTEISAWPSAETTALADALQRPKIGE